MLVVLSGQSLERFRDDLLAHRALSSANDADYATKTLHVSLNTLKKCIGSGSRISLKRHSFAAIVANARLDETRYGTNHLAPAQTAHYGGYSKAEYGFLIGRYFLYRRSFLTAENITRSVLDIGWNDSKACLSFVEHHRYVSDSGVPQSFDYSGDVYMHPERALLSMFATENGEARLTVIHMPSRRTSQSTLGHIRAAGVVLCHGFPKRFYQPVVSAVTVEGLEATRKAQSVASLCKTIKPEMPEFGPLAADLKIAEEHAVVMTPLLWRDQKR